MSTKIRMKHRTAEASAKLQGYNQSRNNIDFLLYASYKGIIM